ncbi:MAG: hypothetical protein JJU05_08505 [Verrucomicrobia bacterium]|nr:hypothetical protein [Verrucomicrobiota bacterium]MCH8527353.1 hypothetical protein [Kiritimatiellia bacterium]
MHSLVIQLQALLSSSKTCLVLLFLCSAGLAAVSPASLRFPDEVDYHQLAESLLAGEGYRAPDGQLTAFRPPGYPFFLWAVYRPGGGIRSVKLIQALLLTATALLLSRIMKKQGHRCQALPPLMILAYPVLLFTSATLYPQTLGAFLFVSILMLMFFQGSALKSLLAGLLLGYLILCIPTFMLTAPVLAFAVLLFEESPFKQRFLRTALLALASLTVVAPWSARNFRVFDAFVPVSSNSGFNLFLGNSENTTPGSGVNVERSHLLPEMQSLPELDRDRRYRDLAVEWIQTHPGKAFRLYLGKAAHYFYFRNRLETASETGRFRDAVLFITWAPLLGLFLFRPFFTKTRPFSAFEKVLWLLIITNVFLTAVFFTRIRFRLPFDVLMILANAMFLDKLLRPKNGVAIPE